MSTEHTEYDSAGYPHKVKERGAAAPAQTEPAPRSDSFWVVERFTDGKSAGYWDGGNSRSFQFDIAKAIQFRRKEDALWATRGWHWGDVKITEHLMMDAAPTEPRVTQTAEQFWPIWAKANDAKDGNDLLLVPYKEPKRAYILFATAFAAHELAAARTDAAKVRDRFRELALAASKCECDHSDDDCCAKACPGQCAWCEYGQLFDIKFRATGTEREPGEAK